MEEIKWRTLISPPPPLSIYPVTNVISSSRHWIIILRANDVLRRSLSLWTPGVSIALIEFLTVFVVKKTIKIGESATLI